jgi:protein-export membrane protein SecD
MRSSTPVWLVVIATITILAVWMVLPNNPGLLGRPIEVRPGLDIQGGLRVLLEAEPGVPVTADSMDRAKQIIENRVNALGVAEPVIQLSGSNRIVVELPGVRDPQQAIDLIKQTGLLEFVDFSKSGACTATFPGAGTYIYTDAQARLRGNPAANGTGTPGATVTANATGGFTATAQGTANGTSVTLTVPATTATTAPTLAPTTAVPTTPAPTSATAEPTKAAQVDPRFVSAMYPAAQATAAATQPAPTAAATAIPPTAPTVAPASTAAATTAATAAATQAAAGTAGPAGTPTPLVRNGATKEQAALNPCTGQPFTTVMTGGGLKDAYAALGSNNQWIIQFSINDNDEGRKFGPYTARSIGQQMAIVLDGQVLSAPVIQARLDTGGQITGNFTQQSSKDLALQLRYGALPIPLNTVSIEQVGASLGADSVAATARAGILGVTIMMIYMILLYRLPGVLTTVALILFGLFNFALYKFIPVTLTLPAITGFLISVGTAVDGNILIFERVREELRSGRPLSRAIDEGFARAWPSIRDSNVSTFTIAAIMFFFGGSFGASAVRGFAVTLMLGLVLNIFTAVIVTRTLIDVLFRFAGARIESNKWLFGE